MNYETHWRTIRKAVLKYFLFFFLWWVPALLIVIALAASAGWVLANVAFILIAVVFFFVEHKLSRPAFYFKCPRCHERFWIGSHKEYDQKVANLRRQS